MGDSALSVQQLLPLPLAAFPLPPPFLLLPALSPPRSLALRKGKRKVTLSQLQTPSRKEREWEEEGRERRRRRRRQRRRRRRRKKGKEEEEEG
jgi:hypothetical protein